MKKCYLLVAALLLATCVSAQDWGEDYFAVGELKKAQKIFENRTSGDPAQTDWYLGEIAYQQGDADAARSYYDKGLAANPGDVFCQIGIAKLGLKTQPEEASKVLETLSKEKVNKKNPEVLTAIAEAYYANDMATQGNKALEAAEAVGNKSAAPNILRGDRMKAAGDPGGAAEQYEQAIMKDADNVPAYVRIARIYMPTNPKAAVERLRELESRQGSNPLVQRYLARVYFTVGKYNDAIAIYQKIYDPVEADIEALTYYAASLFFTDQYDQATALTQQGLTADPDNFVLNRLHMYGAFFRKDYQTGLKVAEKFFSLPVEENDYIARDYTTYGNLLMQNDRIDDAVVQFDKSLELSESAPAAIKQIADILSKAYPETAAKYYGRYVEALGDQAQAPDYFAWGQANYKAATLLARDSVSVDAPQRMTEALNRANDAFAVVSERIVDSHLGPIFQARVNALLDPETTTGLAKPYYEKTVEVILAQEDPAKNKRELIESYRYLSYYYYVKYDEAKQAADKEAALAYCSKILELDPENGVAHQLQDALLGE